MARRGAIKSVILRFAGVYDEDCRAAFIAQQIARIFERLPTAYLFTGDITHGQPYLHRDDLVDAVVRTVDRRAELPDETILLIGEEETPSYQEMQERIGELVHASAGAPFPCPKASPSSAHGSRPRCWTRTPTSSRGWSRTPTITTSSTSRAPGTCSAGRRGTA